MPKVFYHRFNRGFKRGHNNIVNLARGYKTKIPETIATIKDDRSINKQNGSKKLHPIGSVEAQLESTKKDTAYILKHKELINEVAEEEKDRPINPTHVDDLKDGIDNAETQAERDNKQEAVVPEELEADVDIGDEVAQEKMVEDEIIEDNDDVIDQPIGEDQPTGDNSNDLKGMLDFVQSNFERFKKLAKKKKDEVLDKLLDAGILN